MVVAVQIEALLLVGEMLEKEADSGRGWCEEEIEDGEGSSGNERVKEGEATTRDRTCASKERRFASVLVGKRLSYAQSTDLLSLALSRLKAETWSDWMRNLNSSSSKPAYHAAQLIIF